MNILFLSQPVIEDNPRDNITYSFITKEMTALAEAGHRVLFFSSRFTTPKYQTGVTYLGGEHLGRTTRLKALLAILRRPTVFLPCLFLSPARTIWVVRVDLAVRMIIREYEIDIVHSHFMYPDGWSCVGAAADEKIPVVSTIRGAELYNEPELEYGALRDQIFRWLSKRSAVHTSAFTVPNRAMCFRLADTLSVKPENVHYLPNGVERMRPISRADTLSDSLALIAIGRFIKRKNHGLLLHVMNELKGLDISLDLFGTGPLKAEFQDYITKNEMSNVHIRDELPKDELFQRISQSDCLVHPSLIEGMPNVVLESLQLGVPCLLSSIDGHEGLIVEGESGYFFDPNCQSQLRKRIGHIYNNRDALRSMTDACRLMATKYSLTNKINGYEAIYNKLSTTPHLPSS